MLRWALALILFAAPAEAGPPDDAGPAPAAPSTFPFSRLGPLLDAAGVRLDAVQVRGGRDGAAAALGDGLYALLRDAVRAASDAPSQAELDALDASPPFVFASEEDVAEHEHMIFVDATGEGDRASWHEPRWRRQAEVLSRRLTALGADPERISVHPVTSREGFLEALAANAGRKKLYVFGHAGPLEIHFGEESVSVSGEAEALGLARVDMICHYGCQFVNVDGRALEALQDNLPEGTRITLYGHRRNSTKTDDSPWDEENPIVRCEVDGSCARFFEPRREARAAVARTLQAIPWLGLDDSPALTALADYQGSDPVRVPRQTLLSNALNSLGARRASPPGGSLTAVKAPAPPARPAGE